MILNHLRTRHDVKVLACRFDPIVPRGKSHLRPRVEDRSIAPEYLGIPYFPKIGNRINPYLYKRRLLPALKKIQQDYPFDRLLCAWLHPDGWAVGQVAKELRTPFALIAQGSDVHQYLKDRFRKRLIVETANRSLGVITRSADLGRRLQEAGVHSNRLFTVYNGVDHNLFSPGSTTSARNNLSLPKNESIILFVGNLLPIKRPQLIISAFAQFRAQHPTKKCRLIMLGEGPLRDPLAQQIGKLRLEGQVEMPGQQAPERIAEYMRASDCLTLASINEGVPNVLLEALATGLPIVAPAVGGIPEVINRPALGTTLEIEKEEDLVSAWHHQLSSPHSDSVISEYAREFTWEKATLDYEKVLRGTQSQEG